MHSIYPLNNVNKMELPRFERGRSYVKDVYGPSRIHGKDPGCEGHWETPVWLPEAGFY